MAKKVETTLVCDVCASDADVDTYRVSRVKPQPRTLTADLCVDHKAPLEEVLAAKPVPRRKQRAPIPITEVRAQKRRAKKA